MAEGVRWARPGLNVVASGGVPQREPDHSLAGLQLAERLGADVLALQAHVTADGVVVVAPRSAVGLRRRQISSIPWAELADRACRLSSVLASVGSEIALRSPTDATVAAVRSGGLGVVDPQIVGADHDVRERIVLCTTELGQLTDWAQDGWRTVLMTRTLGRGETLERTCARLRDAGAFGIELPSSDWTGGSISLGHRFGLLTWTCDARHTSIMAELYSAGIDYLGALDLERLTDVLTKLRVAEEQARSANGSGLELEAADPTRWPDPSDRSADD